MPTALRAGVDADGVIVRAFRAPCQRSPSTPDIELFIARPPIREAGVAASRGEKIPDIPEEGSMEEEI